MESTHELSHPIWKTHPKFQFENDKFRKHANRFGHCRNSFRDEIGFNLNFSVHGDAQCIVMRTGPGFAEVMIVSFGTCVKLMLEEIKTLESSEMAVLF